MIVRFIIAYRSVDVWLRVWSLVDGLFLFIAVAEFVITDVVYSHGL